MDTQTAAAIIRQQLVALRDENYRDFQSGLIPNVGPETFIGVRTPALRKLAKSLSGTPEAVSFMEDLPHATFDENNLHAFLIETVGTYEEALRKVDAFLPYVDNWATCDQMSPKAFKKQLPALYDEIQRWMKSSHIYTVRFGMGMLMQYYLDVLFQPVVLDLAATVQSDEYYINMMQAWFFATALAKQYDAARPFLTGRKLSKWVHNKTIQKAVESYRITDEQKAYLRTLKWK